MQVYKVVGLRKQPRSILSETLFLVLVEILIRREYLSLSRSLCQNEKSTR